MSFPGSTTWRRNPNHWRAITRLGWECFAKWPCWGFLWPCLECRRHQAIIRCSRCRLLIPSGAYAFEPMATLARGNPSRPTSPANRCRPFFSFQSDFEALFEAIMSAPIRLSLFTRPQTGLIGSVPVVPRAALAIGNGTLRGGCAGLVFSALEGMEVPKDQSGASASEGPTGRSGDRT
jgi:hypothetical protein